VSTSSTPKPDSAAARAAAIEELEKFRANQPIISGTLLGDRDMEGQMRGLPGIFFQLGHTRAETSAVGTCVAVGFISQGKHAMRIYRKTAKGWTQHSFTLHVEAVQKPAEPRRGRARRVTSVTHPPVHTWRPAEQQRQATASGTSASKARRARRRRAPR